ncbi:hypothetical protein BGX26_002981, partial [Mortierella sp. AD094]
RHGIHPKLFLWSVIHCQAASGSLRGYRPILVDGAVVALVDAAAVVAAQARGDCFEGIMVGNMFDKCIDHIVALDMRTVQIGGALGAAEAEVVADVLPAIVAVDVAVDVAVAVAAPLRCLLSVVARHVDASLHLDASPLHLDASIPEGR